MFDSRHVKKKYILTSLKKRHLFLLLNKKHLINSILALRTCVSEPSLIDRLIDNDKMKI